MVRPSVPRITILYLAIGFTIFLHGATARSLVQQPLQLILVNGNDKGAAAQEIDSRGGLSHYGAGNDRVPNDDWEDAVVELRVFALPLDSVRTQANQDEEIRVRAGLIKKLVKKVKGFFGGNRNTAQRPQSPPPAYSERPDYINSGPVPGRPLLRPVSGPLWPPAYSPTRT
ncbi:hypothetical protein BV898_14042 [Hypsibius exemplaris]|uniref:Uncharacterized protein n=1 Tax=Hypsibius exemplaris TaxID=2072580 RepID=A0A1W0W961_HYPEX|nr:hypothetical protein BV898_14042 [Hypsibius exemplaris]